MHSQTDKLPHFKTQPHPNTELSTYLIAILASSVSHPACTVSLVWSFTASVASHPYSTLADECEACLLSRTSFSGLAALASFHPDFSHCALTFPSSSQVLLTLAYDTNTQMLNPRSYHSCRRAHSSEGSSIPRATVSSPSFRFVPTRWTHKLLTASSRENVLSLLSLARPARIPSTTATFPPESADAPRSPGPLGAGPWTASRPLKASSLLATT